MRTYGTRGGSHELFTVYPFVEELEYTIQGASSRPPPCPFEAWDRIGRAQNVLVQCACNATTGGGRHRHHRDGGSRWCRSRPFSWTDVACQLPTTQHAHSGGCCARGGSAAVGNGQWARAGEAGSMPSARLPECLLPLLLRSASRHPWGGSLAADGEVTSELEGWFGSWDRPRMT